VRKAGSHTPATSPPSSPPPHMTQSFSFPGPGDSFFFPSGFAVHAPPPPLPSAGRLPRNSDQSPFFFPAAEAKLCLLSLSPREQRRQWLFFVHGTRPPPGQPVGFCPANHRLFWLAGHPSWDFSLFFFPPCGRGLSSYHPRHRAPWISLHNVPYRNFRRFPFFPLRPQSGAGGGTSFPPSPFAPNSYRGRYCLSRPTPAVVFPFFGYQDQCY